MDKGLNKKQHHVQWSKGQSEQNNDDNDDEMNWEDTDVDEYGIDEELSTEKTNWHQKLIDAGWTEADLYYNNFPQTEEEYIRRLNFVTMPEEELGLVYMDASQFLKSDPNEWGNPSIKQNRISWYRKIRKAQNKFFKQMGILTDKEVFKRHPPHHPLVQPGVLVQDDVIPELDSENPDDDLPEVHIFIDPDTLEITREELAKAERRAELRAKVDARLEDDDCDVYELEEEMRHAEQDEFQRLQKIKLKRVEEWVRDNYKNIEKIEEAKGAMEQELLEVTEIPPKEYIDLLLEIQYSRQQAKEKRKEKQREVVNVLKGMDNLKEDRKWINRKKLFKWNLIKRQSYKDIVRILAEWGTRMLGFFYRNHLFHEFCKACGFYTPKFSIVFHNVSCCSLLFWSVLGLILEGVNLHTMNEIQIWEGNEDDDLVTNRDVSIWAQIFIGCASFCGFVGSYLQLTRFIFMYIVFFAIGWCMFTKDLVNEHSFAEDEELKGVLLSQILEYKTSNQTLGFLIGAQQQFECCGMESPKDYGYNKENLKPGERFALPFSCCHTDSLQFKSQNFTECFISDEPGIPFFVSHRGCFEPLKKFFAFIHEQKSGVRTFYILSTILTLLSFIVYCSHFFTKWLVQTKKQEPEISVAERLMNFLEGEDVDLDIEGNPEDLRNQLVHAQTVRQGGQIITEMMLKLPFLQVADPYEMAEAMIGLQPRTWWTNFASEADLPTQSDSLKRPSISLSMIKGQDNSNARRRISTLLQQDDVLVPTNDLLGHSLFAQSQPTKNTINSIHLPKMQYPLPRPITQKSRPEWGHLTKNVLRNDRINKDRAQSSISESVRSQSINGAKLREAEKIILQTMRLARMIIVVQRGFYYSKIHDLKPIYRTRPLVGATPNNTDGVLQYDRMPKYKRFNDRVERCRARFEDRMRDRGFKPMTELQYRNIFEKDQVFENEMLELESNTESRLSLRTEQNPKYYFPPNFDTEKSPQGDKVQTSVDIQTDSIFPRTVERSHPIDWEKEFRDFVEVESDWTIVDADPHPPYQ